MRTNLDTPTRPNERWSLDFVSDVFGEARRFRMLGVIDDCARECIGLVADTSLSGARVARELDAIVRPKQLKLPSTGAFRASQSSVEED